MNPLHIGLAGPVAGRDLAPLLGCTAGDLPRGYEGAPFLARLARGLVEAGHPVTVFTTSADLPVGAANRAVHSAVHPGLCAVFCPSRARAWRPAGGRPGRILDLYRLERQALEAAMRTHRPDVLHAHWAYEFAWAALDSGLPTVVTSHDAPLRIARLNTWAKPTISLLRWLRAGMAWRVLARSRHVTAVSPYLQRELAGLVRQPVTVVPQSVDQQLLRQGRDRQLGPAPKLALISNGWNHLKNAGPALRAFAQLQARRPALTLHLYGQGFEPDGPAAAWCASQAEMRPARPALHFHGPVPHPALMAALASLDLLLHPSLEESFGMVLVEAMALGLPVVAGAASGAVPWVVDDARCLCDVRSAPAIARTLEAVLQPAVYADLSRGLRARVAARFDETGVRARYLALYDEAWQHAGREAGA